VDFQECECLTGRKREICRNEAGIPLDGPHGVNSYRRRWGLTPLSPMHSTSSPRKQVSRNREVAVSEAFPCNHRGNIIRQDTSNLCGTRGDQVNIHACSVHGECSISRYCQHQTVRHCMRCDDREPPEMPPPFPQEKGRTPFRPSGGVPEFVTSRKLMDDVHKLAAMIPPDTSRIIGVARSGVLPASLVAMLLHLPLSVVRQSMGDMIETGNGWRLTGNTGGKGPPVVIDDTVMTGNSFKQVMPIVWKTYPTAICAAVYVNPDARQKPDLWVRDLPWPHILEWNAPNSVLSDSSAFDFDGIFCRDCGPGEDDDGERYKNFLRTAEPTSFVVRKTVIPLIVTGRMEKYRTETMDWLARHGMAVKSLVMWNGSFRGRTLSAITDYKARHYREFMRQRLRIKPALFFESDAAQAEMIAHKANGIVVCPAAGRCFKA